jgi:hypothetical protein
MEYVYEGEPPLLSIVIVASLPGLHEGMVDVIEVISIAVGCVIVLVVEMLQPFASTALTVYELMFNPLKMPLVFSVPLGNKV